MAKNTLKVRVTLLVTIDLDAYRASYGDESVEEIREAVKYAASDGIRAVLSQGVKDTEIK